jgi:hypothetical protein
MDNKYDKAVRIPCRLSDDFFKYWLLFIQPLHSLTPKIIDVAACLLKNRYLLSKSIIDDNILNKFLMGTEMKEKMLNELKIPVTSYNVALNKLKKAGFLVDGKIEPKFIPVVKPNSKSFNFLLYFDFQDEQ